MKTTWAISRNVLHYRGKRGLVLYSLQGPDNCDVSGNYLFVSLWRKDKVKIHSGEFLLTPAERHNIEEKNLIITIVEFCQLCGLDRTWLTKGALQGSQWCQEILKRGGYYETTPKRKSRV